MTCKFGRIENEMIVRYSCDEVRNLKDQWLEEFKKVNRVSNPEKDRFYQQYDTSINDFLEKCACEIPLTCNKCSLEDHEGNFCRCEARNIKLGKQLREKGDSPWQIRDEK